MLYRILILAQAASDRPAFSWSNVEQDNGVAIAIVGLLIVFTALSLITLFIGFLPNILKALAPILPQSSHVAAPSPAESTAVDEEMVVAAIGLVLHTESQKAMRE